MDNDNLDNVILALLFSADEPLSVRKMVSVLGDVPASDVTDTVDRWRKRFDDEAWSIVLEKVGGGFQLSSRPAYAPYIARLYSGRRKLRLSKAALETLAIIAYKQPITRADIENVRGVGCGSVISNLLERSLVKITGKARVLGAPFLYGTTREFLEYLGLNSLKDLPSIEDLEALLEREESTITEEDTDPHPSGVETSEVLEEGGEPEDVEAEEPDQQEEGAGSAQIGPDIEEPYHKPLGDPGEDPVWMDTPEDEDATVPDPKESPPEPEADERAKKDLANESEK